jgi:hypothetical protein
MAFDENGQAVDCDRKVRARRVLCCLCDRSFVPLRR